MRDRYLQVVGPSGLRGRIDLERWPGPDAPPDAQVPITLDDGRTLAVPRSALHRLPDGRVELLGQVSAQGSAGPGAENRERPQTVVPIIEERLNVSTRPVDAGGVRVRKVAREQDVTVNPPLRQESLLVDRVAVGREVPGPMPIREENGQIIIPLVEEVAMVRRAWILREEVRISKQTVEGHNPKHVRLRSEHAEVERLEPRPAPPRPQEGRGADPRPAGGGVGGA